MFRIGIFGGTFDPPHRGHIEIAKKAKKQLKLDRIYFIPAYIPPHKLNNSSSLAKHRLNMTKLSISKIKNFFISNYELRKGGISYTVDTLRYFRKKFPNAELFLIIGADNFEKFDTWKSPSIILKLSKLAVYKRKGYDNVLDSSKIPFILLKGKYFYISSSEIRDSIKQGKNISKYVNKSVERYIREHLLYRN